MTVLNETRLTDPYPTRQDPPPAWFPRQHPTVWPGPPTGPMSTGEIASYAGQGFHQFALLAPDERSSRRDS